VEVSADLGVAKVHVRLIGSDTERAETLEGLRAAAPFLRRTLGRGLHVRKVPELRFQEDRSLEHARRIEQILSSVLPHDSHDQDAETEGDVEVGEAEPERRE